MISISPFANAVCYIDKTINTPVSTAPNEVFSISADTDTHEYEFVDMSNEQVKLSSIEQLNVLYFNNTSFTATIPKKPLVLSVTDTGSLKIAVTTGSKQSMWTVATIQFGNAIITVENHIE